MYKNVLSYNLRVECKKCPKLYFSTKVYKNVLRSQSLTLERSQSLTPRKVAILDLFHSKAQYKCNDSTLHFRDITVYYFSI